MYTLQSGQIENALRVGGSGDASAKQMVQQLANCQQLLEHRGNVELTKPVINYFPTILPANNSVSYPFTYKDIAINVPPWQMKEWEPQPYIPLPPWQNIDYPPWPQFGWEGLDGKPLAVPGGASLGSTVTRDLTCGPIKASDLDVSGNVRVRGNVYIDGDLRVGGDGFFGGNVTVQGSATFNGPVDMAGPVTVGGVPLTPMTVTVVSNVFWDAGQLKATVRTLRVFGMVQRSLTKTVISGTECP